MGYSTKFTGKIAVKPRLNEHEIAYLRRFADSRHMGRGKGPYWCGAEWDGDESDVLDHNTPGPDQPGLWCNWEPTDDGRSIRWNKAEKFHDSAKWMAYVIRTFLMPGAALQGELANRVQDRYYAPEFEHFTFDHACDGVLKVLGDSPDDRWSLIVTDGEVFVQQKGGTRARRWGFSCWQGSGPHEVADLCGSSWGKTASDAGNHAWHGVVPDRRLTRCQGVQADSVPTADRDRPERLPKPTFDGRRPGSEESAMSGMVLWRSCVGALTVLLFVVYSAVILGFEIGVAVGLHIVKNVWLDVAGGMALFIVPICLYAVMLAVEEDGLDAGFFGGLVLGICGLGVATQTYQGLDDRALHEHGRQIQAIVSYEYWQDNGSDPPIRMVDFTDLSGRPVPGELSGVGGLKVGQRVVVTVDPADKVPMALGTPTGSEAFRKVKISGGIEELALVWPAYRGAVVFLRTKKPRKPQDSQDSQDSQDLEQLPEPQDEPVSRVEPTTTTHETGDALDG